MGWKSERERQTGRQADIETDRQMAGHRGVKCGRVRDRERETDR